MITVYKITNNINDKIYIGVHRTQNLNDGYYGSGKLIKRALKKYGKENFTREYLHIFNDGEEELAFEKEREYVNREFTQREDTYNLSEGGNINPVMYGINNFWYGKKIPKTMIAKRLEKMKGYRHTEESKQQISKSSLEVWKRDGYRERHKISFNLRDLSFITPEYRERARQATLGRKHTEETKMFLSKIKTGVSWGNHTEETKRIIGEKNTGIRTEEWTNKINKNPEKIRKTAETHRGMKRSEEAKRNISISKMGAEGTIAGKIGIRNTTTNKIKYIFPHGVLEEGFIYCNKRNIPC